MGKARKSKADTGGNIPVGFPSSQTIETISHTKVRDLKQPLRLTLPGAIHRVGDKCLASIIPSGVLLYRENDKVLPRFAVASFGEKDPAQGDEIVEAFELRHRKKKPDGFQVVVESHNLTYGEVISAAESGSITWDKPAEVMIRAGYHFVGGARWVVTDAWPTQMATSHAVGINNLLGVWETWNWFMFACHSHWESMFPGFGRWTWCHDTGPCAAPAVCHITGTTATIASGWCTCKC